MNKKLESIKSNLLNLELNEDQKCWYADVTAYFSKTTLKVIDSREGIKMPADGFLRCVNGKEDEKLSFVLYEAKDEFRILISRLDIRSVLIFIQESSFNGFSLEEIESDGAEIPVYKIVAAK